MDLCGANPAAKSSRRFVAGISTVPILVAPRFEWKDSGAGNWKRRRNNMDTRTRFRILSRDSFTCQYCGRKPPEVSLEIDHYLPFVAGGGDSDDNLKTSCHECNIGKSTKIIVRKSAMKKLRKNGKFKRSGKEKNNSRRMLFALDRDLYLKVSARASIDNRSIISEMHVLIEKGLGIHWSQVGAEQDDMFRKNFIPRNLDAKV